MDQGDDLVTGDRRLDFGKSGDYLTGLAGDRQGLERRARNEAARSGRQGRAERGHPLSKPRAKTLRLTASATAARARCNPDAAAGQPAFEIGHDAVRPDHEADHLRNWLDRAADDAKSLRSGPVAARPGIEVADGARVPASVRRHNSGRRRRPAPRRPRPEPAERGPPHLIHPTFKRACMISAFGLLARHVEAVQHAGLPDHLTVLALAPADQIVGRASRKILDGLDVVLSELHQHLWW